MSPLRHHHPLPWDPTTLRLVCSRAPLKAPLIGPLLLDVGPVMHPALGIALLRMALRLIGEVCPMAPRRWRSWLVSGPPSSASWLYRFEFLLHQKVILWRGSVFLHPLHRWGAPLLIIVICPYEWGTHGKWRGSPAFEEAGFVESTIDPSVPQKVSSSCFSPWV